MIFSWYERWRRITAPWLWLTGALAIAAGLAACPPRYTASLKAAVAEALAPGQRLALRAEQSFRARAGLDRPAAADASQLQLRVNQLEAQLAQLRAAQPPAGREVAPLIDSRLITARVLGQQARQFLSSRALLDVGSHSGLADGAVVLDPHRPAEAAPLLDVGAATGAAANGLVLDARSVVGRLSEVGRHTSCLQRITDEGYRAPARIVRRDGQSGPGLRGLLVGVGEAMCHVRMVDISQPVDVGDMVLADGLGGMVGAPPRFGTIVRVAQSPGSAHWDIWVQPDVDVGNLEAVSVLTADVSTVRVAGSLQVTPGMQ